MKLIHLADLHIGSRFERIVDANKRSILISALNNSLHNVIGYAKRNGIKHILLSGDMFDADKVARKYKTEFYSTIRTNESITFYYLKGNHDFDSECGEEISNLKTFNSSSDLNKYEIENNVVVAGFELDHKKIDNLYKIDAFDKDKFNILMLHGDIHNKNDVDYIDLDALTNKNINYFALGHIHKAEDGILKDKSKYAYPGCLVGRGFDELGDNYFVVLDTTNASFEYIKMESYIFDSFEFDVTGIATSYELKNKLAKMITVSPKTVLKIILKGKTNFIIEEDEYKKFLEDKAFYIDIKNLTKYVNTDTENINEASLRGIFIKSVRENNSLTDEEKEKILYYGLNKLTKGEN